MRFVISAALALACACASAPPKSHGTLTELSQSSSALCAHKVPGDVCTRCRPELAAKFKSVNDWCPEHARPESQCLECHSDLTFEPLPELPAHADVKLVSRAGEDVPLEGVRGKVTVFDFYADWCAPCRKVDRRLHEILRARDDVAVRKLNLVSWESPLARRHLAGVASLPFVIVYDKNSVEVGRVSGLDLAKLDQLVGK